MVLSRGESIVIPIRHTPTLEGGFERDGQKRRLKNLRAELAWVKRALRALEKLAASRASNQRDRAPKIRVVSVSCGSGRG